MGKDNRRIAAPDNCMSPNAFKKLIKIPELVNEKGLRCDERTADDLRLISLTFGIVPEVTGSAYLECGNTKIICSVNGPRDVLHKSDSSVKGQLYCEFKYATFSCIERQPYQPSDEELGISKSIQYALEPVVMLHKFPKARLDIYILVLENDGGAIGASITCAGAALSNAGVEMYDLPIGCSLVQYGSCILLDPTGEEEHYGKLREDFGKITIGMMAAYKSQVIYMNSCGSLKNAVIPKGLKILQTACQNILIDVRECLKQHVMNRGSTDNITAAELKLFQPQKYITTFLENNIRPDGRKLTEFRPVVIDVGSFTTANGSALVRSSGTSVLCGIKAELTNPTSNEPSKGFFVPNVTLTSICSNRFTPGPPSEQAQVYTQMIMDLWKNSDFLPPEKLCIVEKKLAWCVFAEIICLSYDGNILDACILSLMAALKNTKLPEVVVNADNNSIEVINKPLALDIDSNVFSVTYAILKDNAIADPSLEEETLEDASVTVFLNDDDTTCIHSSGFVQEDTLMYCIKCAKDRHSEMKSLIDTFN